MHPRLVTIELEYISNLLQEVVFFLRPAHTLHVYGRRSTIYLETIDYIFVILLDKLRSTFHFMMCHLEEKETLERERVRVSECVGE